MTDAHHSWQPHWSELQTDIRYSWMEVEWRWFMGHFGSQTDRHSHHCKNHWHEMKNDQINLCMFDGIKYCCHDIIITNLGNSPSTFCFYIKRFVLPHLKQSANQNDGLFTNVCTLNLPFSFFLSSKPLIEMPFHISLSFCSFCKIMCNFFI